MTKNIDKRLLPLSRPELPSVTDFTDSKEFTKAFDKWESDCFYVLEENELRFKKALKIVKKCAFKRSFISAISFRNKKEDHYDWCPYEAWYNEDGF